MQPLHQLLGLNLATTRQNADSSPNTLEVPASANSSGVELERCQQKLERPSGTSRLKSVVSANSKSTAPGPSIERLEAAYSSNTWESHVAYKFRLEPWYYYRMTPYSVYQPIITSERNDYSSKEQRIDEHNVKNMVPAPADSSRAEYGTYLERPCGRKKNTKSGNSSPSHMTSHNEPSSIFLSPGLSSVRLDATSPNYRPHRTLSPVPCIIVRQKQRAVLCGVTYNKKGKYKLKGTLADVKNMKDLLVNHFRFPEEGIRILAEEKDNALLPTRKNIVNSLRWLVHDCQYGDSLVFFFSGLGLRKLVLNCDEGDGFDETICPVDYMEQGMIIDYDINDIIVRPLTAGVTLHAIVDASHCGTILDLPLVYDHRGERWEDNRPPSKAYKGTCGGLAISFSACSDHEMAAETSAFPGKTMNGAMTYIFTKAINENPDITYGQLLAKLHQEITVAKGVYILKSERPARVFRKKIAQEPLLSSSMEFDVNKTKYSFYPCIDISWS